MIQILLPPDEHIQTLEQQSFRKALRHIHRAGTTL
jgi:hypothetical protein